MPTMDQAFPFILLGILGFFAWRYFRSGSLVGALLGGRITDTMGQIELSSSGMSTRTLTVSLLGASDGKAKDVALTVTSKALFGASVIPFKLTQDQAQELIGLLQQAIRRLAVA